MARDNLKTDQRALFVGFTERWQVRSPPPPTHSGFLSLTNRPLVCWKGERVDSSALVSDPQFVTLSPDSDCEEYLSVADTLNRASSLSECFSSTVQALDPRAHKDGLAWSYGNRDMLLVTHQTRQPFESREVPTVYFVGSIDLWSMPSLFLGSEAWTYSCPFWQESEPHSMSGSRCPSSPIDHDRTEQRLGSFLTARYFIVNYAAKRKPNKRSSFVNGFQLTERPKTIAQSKVLWVLVNSLLRNVSSELGFAWNRARRLAQPSLPASDPSLDTLRTLQDETLSESERRKAFGQMLTLDKGWWGEGSLVQFARTAARMSVRRTLASKILSPDQVDWGGVADDALIILFQSAHQIKDAPGNWLAGVIRNLVKNEVKRLWRQATHSSDLLHGTVDAADRSSAVRGFSARSITCRNLVEEEMIDALDRQRAMAHLCNLYRSRLTTSKHGTGSPAPEFKKTVAEADADCDKDREFRVALKGALKTFIGNSVLQEMRGDDISTEMSGMFDACVSQEPASQMLKELSAMYEHHVLAKVTQELPPALRAVGDLLLVKRLSRQEVCAELRISDHALRKRVERMRRVFVSRTQPQFAR
jgi:DNA-directed RNA polymerase specialized sigma24 family protein